MKGIQISYNTHLKNIADKTMLHKKYKKFKISVNW